MELPTWVSSLPTNLKIQYLVLSDEGKQIAEKYYQKYKKMLPTQEQLDRQYSEVVKQYPKGKAPIKALLPYPALDVWLPKGYEFVGYALLMPCCKNN